MGDRAPDVVPVAEPLAARPTNASSGELCVQHSSLQVDLPGGVPVMMMVPGGSVVPVERYATILSISALPSAWTTPSSRSRLRRYGRYIQCTHCDTFQIIFCAVPD
jgi:hypothetical protein